jgi:hypothetical protein
MNTSCRANRWHVCPLSLRVLHHEARTHDDVPTGNVGRGLPRAIRNLELDETDGRARNCPQSSPLWFNPWTGRPLESCPMS